MHFRIPWGRLNVTDPTSSTVLDDPRPYSDNPPRDTLSTTKIDGIRFTLLLGNGEEWEKFPEGNEFLNPPVFTWKTWSTPDYRERVKGSYSYIQAYFETIQ